MKQGTGNNSDGGHKIEPRSTGYTAGYAGSIGIQEVRTRSQQVYAGRGIEAPKATTTIHHSGSQGKR